MTDLRRGTKTLLVGNPGSGKTTALISFLKAGLKLDIDPHLAVIVTDPEGEESLYLALAREKIDASRLHVNYIPPTVAGFTDLLDKAKKIRTLSYAGLTALKGGGGNPKDEYSQFITLLNALANITDDRTGEHFGPVDDLPPNWMVAVDSLSGMNYMARKLMIGEKPTAQQGEWGVSMDLEEDFIMKIAAIPKCFITCTAHLEQRIEGGEGLQYMPEFLGKKLAPRMPRLFSDVVLQHRPSSTDFKWSTFRKNHDCLKARNLPHSDTIPPSFEPMIKNRIQITGDN